MLKVSEYIIEHLMPDPPKEWKNPKGGTIYYIEVMVKGHPKPVSVGKKTPDALKEGDTIHGEIIDTDYLTDKFKHSEIQPQGSQSSQEPKFLKDLSDLPLRVYSATLPYIDAQGLIKGGDYRREFLEYVKDVSDELLAMSDNIRGDNEATTKAKEVFKEDKAPLPLPPEEMET